MEALGLRLLQHTEHAGHEADDREYVKNRTQTDDLEQRVEDQQDHVVAEPGPFHRQHRHEALHLGQEYFSKQHVRHHAGAEAVRRGEDKDEEGSHPARSPAQLYLGAEEDTAHPAQCGRVDHQRSSSGDLSQIGGDQPGEDCDHGDHYAAQSGRHGRDRRRE